MRAFVDLRVESLLALLLLVLAGALAPLAVRAQPGEARAHFDAGREHARAERWAEALAEFQAAEELFPRPVTEFNIASALMRLGRVREALLEIAHIEGRTDLDDAFRRDVATLRAAARASIRTIVVTVDPEDARLEVDGEVIEGSGARRELEMDPGTHLVTVRAPGFAERRVTLGPVEHTLALELEALPAVLVIDSEPEATITIDGVPRGLGHLEEVVSPGRHAIEVTLAGRVPFSAAASVGPGERTLVTATLPLVPPSPSIAEDPVFWAVLGSSVAAVAIGVVVGVVVGTGSPQAYGGTSGVVIAPLHF